MKKFLLVILLTSFFAGTSFASHLMGGEITWKCLGTGQFVFNVKLYRDCNGINGPSSISLQVHNYPGLTSIPLNLVSKQDNSPVCDIAGPTITCGSAQAQPGFPASATPVPGAVEEYLYQSAPIFLSGTPPAAGWIFTFDDCCRNFALTNIDAASVHGFTLRAKMFSYDGKNTNPCYDSSPEFFEKARTIRCTGYPFAFNHNAVDVELDSLHYAWAHPLDWFAAICGFNFITDSCPASLNFNPGYSYDSPLPGPAMNPQNAAATLDPNTGEIKYSSFTPGNFEMNIEVSAYKCGVLVAQVYREIQTVLIPCSDIVPGRANNNPKVAAPFLDSFGFPASYIDTVYAGDLVDLVFTCVDSDLTAASVFQDLTITASGAEFDSAFTNSNGNCLLPPCATLSPPPAQLTGQQTLSTEFRWQTSCRHVRANAGCMNYSNVYNFVFKASDGFCPLPGTAVSTLTIVVLPAPSVLAITKSNDTLFCSTDPSYLSYQWYRNNSLIPGATDSMLVTAQGEGGYYQVRVLQADSCIFSASLSIVGFSEYVDRSTVFLSPNPVESELRVLFDKAGMQEISICDVLGRVALRPATLLRGKNESILDVSSLPAGIYFLQLKWDKGGVVKRFVKE